MSRGALGEGRRAPRAARRAEALRHVRIEESSPREESSPGGNTRDRRTPGSAAFPSPSMAHRASRPAGGRRASAGSGKAADTPSPAPSTPRRRSPRLADRQEPRDARREAGRASTTRPCNCGCPAHTRGSPVPARRPPAASAACRGGRPPDRSSCSRSRARRPADRSAARRVAAAPCPLPRRRRP